MKTCEQCSGRGQIECIHCYGSGKHGSNPSKPCSYCKGTKTQKCPVCFGTGKDDRA